MQTLELEKRASQLERQKRGFRDKRMHCTGECGYHSHCVHCLSSTSPIAPRPSLHSAHFPHGHPPQTQTSRGAKVALLASVVKIIGGHIQMRKIKRNAKVIPF